MADITYGPTWAGFLFLAAVIDFSPTGGRMVDVGQPEHRARMRALKMTVTRQRPASVVAHHSDQGCQYSSYDFAKACQAVGVERSMGSVGDCYDNVIAECFLATLECELIERSVSGTATRLGRRSSNTSSVATTPGGATARSGTSAQPSSSGVGGLRLHRQCCMTRRTGVRHTRVTPLPQASDQMRRPLCRAGRA